MRRIDLYKINLSSILLLGAGFITSLIIPKLAISSMGIKQYGGFAVLLGVCLIPSFFELGLTPGLTSHMGSLYAQKRYAAVQSLTRKFQRWLGGLGLAVTFVISYYAAAENTVADLSFSGIFVATLAGGTANVVMLVTELGLIRVRVSGGIVAANMARGYYFGVYFTVVMVLFLVRRLTVDGIFLGQLVGAVAYFFASSPSVRKCIPDASEEVKHSPVPVPWRRLFVMAAPEQVSRAQSSLVPSFERNILAAVGGASAVGAYDITLRLSALVTAMPSSLAAPLIALLSPNVATGDHGKNRWILRHTDLLTWPLVMVSTVFTLLIAKYFALGFYHLEGTPFLFFAGCILVGSGVNVLTASPGAFLYSHNKPVPLLLKNSADFALAVTGIWLMAAYKSPVLFVAVRYVGFIFTAGSLITYYLINRGKIMATAGGNTAEDSL